MSGIGSGSCKAARFMFSLSAAASAAVACTSCAVNEAREVQTYRAVLDDGLPSAEDIELHEELGVIDVMTLASARSEPLAIEGETYLQSLIDRRRAAAAFLPTIALSPSYSWRDVPGGGGGADGGFSSGSSRGTWNTSIGADFAVNPVRDLASVREAGATAREQHALLLDFQDTLLLDVARAHYEVIRAERSVAVLESSVRVQDERVEDARARLSAGLVRPLDLSLTEAQAAQTAATLVEAQVAARSARLQLALLTATPLSERVLVDELELPPSIPDLVSMLELAEMQRQDVRAAARRIEAASFRVESAYGQYFPSVSLNLQWFLQRDSEPTDLDWTSLFQISLPLFSAGLIEADVRDALSELRQAKLNDQFTRRVVRRDVEIALANLLASFDRVDRVRVQVRSASEALEQSEGLYQVGLATNLERLTAQDALLTAELNLVNAELDSKVFYLDLRRTTGSLHELLGLTRPAESEQRSARAP